MSENRQSKKLGSEPCFPAFVEAEALNQVLQGFVQDLDSHDSFLRISALAVSQSMNRDYPSANRSWRSARMSLCQAGDSMDSGARARSSHSDSMAASFSWRVISVSGRLKGIGPVYPRAEKIQIPLRQTVVVSGRGASKGSPPSAEPRHSGTIPFSLLLRRVEGMGSDGRCPPLVTRRLTSSE